MRLVAWELYDGPITGIVVSDDDAEAFLFRLLAWDMEQKLRVFELVALESEASREVLQELATIEPTRWPEWWLRASGAAPTRMLADALSKINQRDVPVAVVISANLLYEITAARRLNTPDATVAFAKLNQRAREDDEVTVTPFDEWQRFVSS